MPRNKYPEVTEKAILDTAKRLFLEHGSRALELAGGYLRTIGGFYLLSFFGHSFVGWYRGEGRMNVTFLCTTVQVGCRVLGTYLLVPALGLNAVAWATGLGWVVMLAVQLGIFFGGLNRTKNEKREVFAVKGKYFSFFERYSVTSPARTDSSPW